MSVSDLANKLRQKGSASDVALAELVERLEVEHGSADTQDPQVGEVKVEEDEVRPVPTVNSEALALFAELLAKDPSVSRDDYFDKESQQWDLEGMRHDLEIARSKAAEAAEAKKAKLAEASTAEASSGPDGSALLAELQSLGGVASKEDYFDEESGTWDMEGLQDDLALQKSKHAKKAESQAAPAAAKAAAAGAETESTYTDASGQVVSKGAPHLAHLSDEEYEQARKVAAAQRYIWEATRPEMRKTPAPEVPPRRHEPVPDPEAMLTELMTMAPMAKREDYFDPDSGTWDIEGLSEDLRLSRMKTVVPA